MTTETASGRISETAARAGMIGTGAFAVTLLAQSRLITALDIAVVCDRNVDIARRACRRAGWPAEKLAACDNGAAVAQAIRNEQCALVDDPELVISAVIDVLVECTGDPEAGAIHALGAIRAGRHVVMVNKETDAVVGPILNRLAFQAGRVYTPVDGDQHGLLIAFVDWARALGLSVVCAGKARNEEGVIDRGRRKIHFDDRIVDLDAVNASIWAPMGAGQGRIIAKQRMTGLVPAPRAEEPDLCEMAIVANATGLVPDIPTLHSPIVRIAEIPETLAPHADGGLLQSGGRVEVITCLRDSGAPGMGGGIFIVVACSDDPPWDLIKSKGFAVNDRGTCALLIRPFHLLGVETPRTILAAVRRHHATVDADYRPRFDLTARAARDLTAGTRLTGADESGALSLEALITPAQPAGGRHPVPFFMAVGRRLKVDLAAGEMLRVDMLDTPVDSTLWSLRRQQDDFFL